MRPARPGEQARPQRLLAAGLMLAFGAAATGARAQTAEECARLPTQTEEIACLRRALDQALSRTQPAAAPAAEQPSASARRGAPAAAAPARSGPTAQPQGAAAASEPARPAQPSQLGAEQVAAQRSSAAEPKPERERIQTVVTAAAADHLGLLTLQLRNGQVWRQTESAGVPLRLAERRPYAVEIARSGFGGYRMRFPEMNRQIVVKRIK